jgi:putative nucleotide binding protein
MPNEENAIVLDYLPTGKSNSFKSEPVAQVIGVEHFTLLEVIPSTPLKALEKVYIGKDKRDKIQFIKKRIFFSELTNNSVSEIQKAIELIVKENSQKFLDFFNKSGSLSLRMHQLELLPGLGKKHLFEILKERESKPFESFEEISKRIHLMPDPIKLIVKRVMLELEDNKLKYYVFVRPPAKESFR